MVNTFDNFIDVYWYLRFLFLKFSIEAALLVMSVILWEAWVVPKYRN